MSEDAEDFAGYVSARVRSMKSQLLEQSKLETFIDKKDAAAIGESLLSSSYEDEMAEALTHLQGPDAIEDAASRNLVKTFATLRRMCRGGRTFGILSCRCSSLASLSRIVDLVACLASAPRSCAHRAGTAD